MIRKNYNTFNSKNGSFNKTKCFLYFSFNPIKIVNFSVNNNKKRFA